MMVPATVAPPQVIRFSRANSLGSSGTVSNPGKCPLLCPSPTPEESDARGAGAFSTGHD